MSATVRVAISRSAQVVHPVHAYVWRDPGPMTWLPEMSIEEAELLAAELTRVLQSPEADAARALIAPEVHELRAQLGSTPTTPDRVLILRKIADLTRNSDDIGAWLDAENALGPEAFRLYIAAWQEWNAERMAKESPNAASPVAHDPLATNVEMSAFEADRTQAAIDRARKSSRQWSMLHD